MFSASLAGKKNILRRLNQIAGALGYRPPIPFLVNALPVEMELTLEGHLARNTYLHGSVTMKSGSAVMRDCFVKGNVVIHESATLGQGTEVRGDVEIGRYANLAGKNWIRGDVHIGDFAAIGPETAFQSTSLEPNQPAMQQEWQRELLGKDPLPNQKPIRLGNDVWIGRDAIVLRDVNIGHGACIGAKAVVTKDVEPFEIVAGVPAQNIGWRFDKSTREKMLDIAWWDWEIDEIRKRFPEIEEVIYGS